METILGFISVNLFAFLLLAFIPVRWKGILTLIVVGINATLSSLLAMEALQQPLEYTFSGSVVSGPIPIRIDGLSAWFIFTINFTFITGAIYGFHYMKAYRSQTASITIHCISYLIVQAALISICVLQNSLVFLFTWEIMAIGSFILIIFDHHKQEVIKAGINFLVQAHVCIVLLMVAFIWVAAATGSFDFKAINAFTTQAALSTSLALFIIFFCGFAIKAGFVPFHTWLPYAHPAAPAHVSGVMSGVIIKIGIYGILRMILLVNLDFTIIGYIILFFSVISGVYGVTLAIIQHNLKKLLAYHSIENIGIIGIGIGLGCMGIGTGNSTLTLLGFSGALLHTLNHSLFKSVLFYGAGNVYQATHTVNIEHLGGIIKKMPHTSILFLIAALAICGLPPFNGFVSEFLIYNGMFIGMRSAEIPSLSVLIFAVFGLVLIGGLAMLCFTKAFGVVFLGVQRHAHPHEPEEAEAGKLIPMYLGVALIAGIGLFPGYFLTLLAEPIKLFMNNQVVSLEPDALPALQTLKLIGYASFGFLCLSSAVLFFRMNIISNRPQRVDETWGCGYVAPNNKMQYTASSYVRTFRKLISPVLMVHKKKKGISGIFPVGGWHETHPSDKVEEVLI